MILITGIHGYIGSHMAQRLNALRMPFLGLDKFKPTINGIEFDASCPDLCDIDSLDTYFSKHTDITHVFHFAGFKSIRESISDPHYYLHNNINSTLNLVEAIKGFSPNAKLIFSSSASVYGNCASPVKETDPISPQNPYALSKSICEQIITASGINYSILRYFNPVGELYRIQDRSKDSINHALRQENFTIFGDDYPTKDGTPIRDFVPINELIDAHLHAMEWGNEIVNIGRGVPTTVKELAEERGIKYTIGKRREGDVAELWADTSKYKSLISSHG